MNTEAKAGISGGSKDFIIDCGDILLREYKVEDLDALCALTQQPEIKKFLPDWDVPKEQRLDWLINYETVDNQRFLEAVSKDGNVEDIYLRLGIILKETGEFIGWCCSGMKEELPAPNREIMYAISATHRNKGYTTQAVRGMMLYLFENTNVEQLNAIALIRNIPSNRVIQKIGFEFVNTIEIDDESYHWYKFTKQTYLHRRDSTGLRSPSEQELISVLESNGYENEPFAMKYYSDHAIAIGDHYVCKVSLNIYNDPQFICDYWDESNDGKIAVKELGYGIGIIIQREDVLEHGRKVRVTFEYNSTVEMTMNHEQGLIIDHPLGKETVSSQAKVEIFNSEGAIIYQNDV